MKPLVQEFDSHQRAIISCVRPVDLALNEPCLWTVGLVPELVGPVDRIPSWLSYQKKRQKHMNGGERGHVYSIEFHQYKYRHYKGGKYRTQRETKQGKFLYQLIRLA